MDSRDSTVTTGLDRVRAQPGLLAADGHAVGLVTNFTGLTSDLRPGARALLDSGVPLRALFGPEHGVHGTAQAGESESEAADPVTGLPVLDTYRHSGAELDRLVEQSGVDVLVFDIQDVGSRFYTYIWTLFDCMLSAARIGMRFIVLDRPNPIGGTVSTGPMLDPGFASFVGRARIPVRYGLTIGELCRHLNRTAVAETAGRPADLDVVPMQGWRRGMFWEQTGLPWVPPSPNLPTVDTAVAYPGTCLVEGTNMSEGRGTTRPFEIVGAPYVDDRYADALTSLDLDGVLFRDTFFVPTFHKHAGTLVRGVQVHVTDRVAFEPVRTGVALLQTAAELYPGDFAARLFDDGPEGAGYPLDRLWGSDSLRAALSKGEDALALVPAPEPPEQWIAPETLLYG